MNPTSYSAHWLFGLSAVLFLLLTCPNTRGQSGDGHFLFVKHCQSCHRPDNKANAPLQTVLSEMSGESILAALEGGKMKPQGARLTPAERLAIAEFLSHVSSEAMEKPNPCLASAKSENREPWPREAIWNGWGIDSVNSRFQRAEAAGLVADDIPRLKVKWAFGLPHVTTVLGQPTIVGGRLYFGSQGGTVYSLDARSGCTYWTMRAPADVRTAITVSADGAVLYFGDGEANFYAVDSTTGKVVWKTRLDQHPFAVITGSPKLSDGRLYVSVSSVEEIAAANPEYACCTFRGSVVALRALDGKQIWKTYTIRGQAKPTGRISSGTQHRGQSGAAVWLSPTLDPVKNVVYVGTGDNYSHPASEWSDAILALDRDRGRVLWAVQATPNDAWNLACLGEEKRNCPEHTGGDFDFGASPILTDLGSGRRVLIAGQKSGVVYGLDPDHRGKFLWQTRLGKGGDLGGIEWGGASDDSKVYFAVSDYNRQHPETGGGLHALRPDTGEKVWSVQPPKPACLEQPGCLAAQMAPVTVIPGVVFSGSMDGHLRAFAASDGRLLWDLDTLRDFETVNKVKAHGGSINATGAVVAGGMLFVNSGYGSLGLPGNVLLAFSVDGK